MQLIPITIIFLMIYAYTTILNKKTIYTIPLTFLTIIPFTMIFGYLKMLKHIDIAIIILLIIAYIYIYRKKLYKNKLFFNNQTLIFLVFSIFIIILNFKFTIFEWDAFSHWATAAKYMINTDSFYTLSSYPPGITSLQFFYSKLALGYNESYLVNALLLFTMSMFMPLFELIKNNHKFLSNLAGLILFMIVPLTFFNNLYGSVYVDCILGLELAFILYNYYFNKEKKLSNLLICLTIFSLVMTKEIGLVLACSFIICLFIDKLFNKEVKIKQIIILTLIVVISFLGWNMYVSNNQTSLIIGTTNKSSLIKELLTKEKITYMITIANNFLNFISNTNIMMNIFNITFLNFLIIAIFILLIFKKYNYIKDFTIISFCYLGFLAFSYMCFFSEEEALRLASVDRYIYSLYIAIIFIILALIMKKLDINVSYLLFSYLILFGNFTAIEYNLVFKPYSTIKNKQYRQEYDQAKIIQNKVRKNSKIYFLDTENTPYACYLARYENINMQFSNTRYNQYIDEDVIKLYDYLFVYSYNDEFKENNKKKFDELKPFTLYKINENNYTEVTNEK